MSKPAYTHLLRVSEATNSRLHCIVQRHGPIFLAKSDDSDIFLFLARTLIGQQLSGSAANTIWIRFLRKAAELEVAPIGFCIHENFDRIRNCGVSRSKTKALIILQEACSEKVVLGEAILAAKYSEIVELVTSLWGFGQWSADMTAIFYAGLPDIFPRNDVALQRALHLLGCGGLEYTGCSAFSPYRSYLARHIWKALDSGMIHELTAG
jgi:DNA-3-methyladenine glycosylase II